jgi:DNA-directed RNA polymerase subunit F
MEVLDPNLGPLCYFEVDRLTKQHYNERKAAIIRQKKINRQKKQKHQQFFLEFSPDVMEIEDKIHDYLKKYTKVKRQTKEYVNGFIKALEKFDLTTTEKMHLLNIAPDSLVEIHMIIDHCSSRFHENETVELLALVKQYLHNDPPPKRKGKDKEHKSDKEEDTNMRNAPQQIEAGDDLLIAMNAASF